MSRTRHTAKEKARILREFLPETVEVFGEGSRFLRILTPLDESIRKLASRQGFPDREGFPEISRLLHSQGRGSC